MAETGSLAEWVGALGSAGAACVAVAVYLVDKVGARRREREARRSARSAQALRVYVFLQPIFPKLYSLMAFASAERPTSESPEKLYLPDPQGLLTSASEVPAFQAFELSAMADAAIAITKLNLAILKGVERSGDSEFVRSSQLDPEDVEDAIARCAHCYRRVGLIAEVVEH